MEQSQRAEPGGCLCDTCCEYGLSTCDVQVPIRVPIWTSPIGPLCTGTDRLRDLVYNLLETEDRVLIEMIIQIQDGNMRTSRDWVTRLKLQYQVCY